MRKTSQEVAGTQQSESNKIDAEVDTTSKEDKTLANSGDEPVKQETVKVRKPRKKQEVKKIRSKKVEPEKEAETVEKMDIEPVNLNTTVPSTPGNSLSCQETLKKLDTKKPASKNQEELAQAIKYLFKLEEEESLNYKVAPCKSFPSIDRINFSHSQSSHTCRHLLPDLRELLPKKRLREPRPQGTHPRGL